MQPVMIDRDSSAPLVSVCVPVYNSAKYLEQTLLSIMEQEFADMEIIVIDNASVDNTVAIASNVLASSRHPYAVVQNAVNIGYAGNCNKAISLARGKLISILHGDDVYNPSIVGMQVEVLEKHPEFLGCFAFPSCIDEAGEPLRRAPYKIEEAGSDVIDVDLETYVDTLCRNGDNILFCPSAMIRAEAYQKAGPYDPESRLVEDADMWLRLLRLGNLAIINKRLVDYRIHSSQGSAEFRIEEGSAVDKDIRFIEAFVRANFHFLRREADYYLENLRRLRARRELRRLVRGVRSRQFAIESAAARARATQQLYRFGLDDARAWIVQRYPLLALSLLRGSGKA